MIWAAQILKSRFCCLGVLSCACMLSLSSQAYAVNKTEWQIEQRHIVNGVSLIQCAPNAVHVVNKLHGWQLLSLAPDWKVHVFRTDEKILHTLSKLKFFDIHGYTPNQRWRASYDYVATRKFANLKVEIFRDVSASIWVCQIPGIPNEITDILNACNKSRAVNRLVLKKVSVPTKEKTLHDSRAFRFIDDRPGGTVLDTISMQEIPVRTADFTLPKNLREVADIKQITTSAATRKEAESIFQQMGIGEVLGNEKRK